MSMRQNSRISDFRNEMVKYQFYNSRSCAKGLFIHTENIVKGVFRMIQERAVPRLQVPLP